jgi:hypothetical protein
LQIGRIISSAAILQVKPLEAFLVFTSPEKVDRLMYRITAWGNFSSVVVQSKKNLCFPRFSLTKTAT